MWDLKTYFIQEMLSRGIYTFGSHNLNFSHKKDDIDLLLRSYRAFFNELKTVFECNIEIKKLLCCDALKPLFKVR